MRHFLRYCYNKFLLLVTIIVLLILSRGKPVRIQFLRDAWKARNEFQTPWDNLESVAIMSACPRIASFCQDKSDEDWVDYVMNYK
jgi:hypothetical protein